jgi:peroxiredoxin Q/BCP
MVSVDTPERNREFAESLSANFVVLSDPDRKAARAFGVLGESGSHARRWTFYIDREGIIRRVDRNVRASSHGEDVARALSELRFPRR